MNEAKEAKECLAEIKLLDTQIDCMLSTVDDLRESLLRITQMPKQDMVSGGSGHDRMSTTIAKIVDLENEINAKVDAYIDKKTQIIRLLEKLRNPDYLKVLQLRYIECESLEEIAAEMEMPVERVKEIKKVAQEPVSLETPIGEEEDSHLGDFIPDDDAPSPSELAAYTLLREQLEEIIQTLTPREAKVLKLRFGLEDGKARTLEEVGKEFQVTRERIRQIEAKALRKLRHPSRSKKLKDYM